MAALTTVSTNCCVSVLRSAFPCAGVCTVQVHPRDQQHWRRCVSRDQHSPPTSSCWLDLTASGSPLSCAMPFLLLLPLSLSASMVVPVPGTLQAILVRPLRLCSLLCCCVQPSPVLLSAPVIVHAHCQQYLAQFNGQHVLSVLAGRETGWCWS